MFQTIEYIKTLLSPLIKDKTNKEVKIMLCHCVYFRSGRRKTLSVEERAFYDLLLKNKLSPKTLYKKWLLLEAPEHVKRQIREKKISLNEARSRSYAHKRMISTLNGKELIAEIKKVIGGLEWKGLIKHGNQS